MQQKTIDLVIWLVIIATLFMYAGYTRGFMNGFIGGYEIGHEIAREYPNSPKTFNIWK